MLNKDPYSIVCWIEAKTCRRAEGATDQTDNDGAPRLSNPSEVAPSCDVTCCLRRTSDKRSSRFQKQHVSKVTVGTILPVKLPNHLPLLLLPRPS